MKERSCQITTFIRKVDKDGRVMLPAIIRKTVINNIIECNFDGVYSDYLVDNRGRIKLPIRINEVKIVFMVNGRIVIESNASKQNNVSSSLIAKAHTRKIPATMHENIPTKTLKPIICEGIIPNPPPPMRCKVRQHGSKQDTECNKTLITSCIISLVVLVLFLFWLFNCLF